MSFAGEIHMSSDEAKNKDTASVPTNNINESTGSHHKALSSAYFLCVASLACSPTVNMEPWRSSET